LGVNFAMCIKEAIRAGFNFAKSSLPVWRGTIFAQFSEMQINRIFPVIQYFSVWYRLLWFFFKSCSRIIHL